MQLIIDTIANEAKLTENDKVASTLYVMLIGALQDKNRQGAVFHISHETGTEVYVTIENAEQIAEAVAKDEIELPDFFVVDESEFGTDGVGIGFSSADREQFSFPYPEDVNADEFLGNDDPMIYKTQGKKPYFIIKGVQLV